MKLSLDGKPLHVPGDKATFVDAPDIEVHIFNVTIFGADGVSYEVSWIDDGKRNCESVRSFELTRPKDVREPYGEDSHD